MGRINAGKAKLEDRMSALEAQNREADSATDPLNARSGIGHAVSARTKISYLSQRSRTAQTLVMVIVASRELGERALEGQHPSIRIRSSTKGVRCPRPGCP